MRDGLPEGAAQGHLQSFLAVAVAHVQAQVDQLQDVESDVDVADRQLVLLEAVLLPVQEDDGQGVLELAQQSVQVVLHELGHLGLLVDGALQVSGLGRGTSRSTSGTGSAGTSGT